MLGLASGVRSQNFDLGSDAHLKYKGSVFAAGWWYPETPVDPSQPDWLSSVGGREDLVLQLPMHLEARANAQVQLDLRDSDRNRYVLDDLYLDYSSDHFEIRAGLQIFSWKTVETVSQADFLNQKDWDLDFLDPPKRSELAIRTRFKFTQGSNHTIELYYLPYFNPAELPGRGNRYDILAGTAGVELRNGEPIYDSPHKRWRPEGAIRYTSTWFDKIDVAAFYFNGYRRFPFLDPEFSPATGKVTLRQRYTPVSITGATFQGVLENWLIKGEMAYNMFEQDQISQAGTKVDPYLTYSLGFEYTIYSPIVDNQDLGAILEFIGDSDWGKDSRELEGFRTNRSNIFLGMRYAFNNVADQSLFAGAMVDYQNYDLYIQSFAEQKISDNFRVRFECSGFTIVRSEEMAPFSKTLKLGGKVSYNW